jgi:hypothetical protein
MSKLACWCGAVIDDAISPSETEGTVFRDIDGPVSDIGAKHVAAYIEAVCAGHHREWLRSWFSDEYPTDGTHEEIVSDILMAALLSKSLAIAECRSCGRLWVQLRAGQNDYKSFAPDEPGYCSVLRGARPVQ